MTGILGIIIRVYDFLLRLYPGSFRRNFEEQMLLDFSDMVADARKRGKWALTFFCLRELIDFPINLLKMHLEKETVTPNFHPGAARNILRIALAFGLALAIKNVAIVISFMTFTNPVQLAAILRFASRLGWQASYADMVSILLNFSYLILGPLVVATVLLIIFPEVRPIKRYLPAIALAFALPTIPDSLRTTILQNVEITFEDTIFATTYYILIGLGFGATVSILSHERRKTLWLLFAGPLGFILTMWVSNVLTLHLYHEHTITLWKSVASLALRNLLIGMTIGLLLGVVLEFKRRDNSPDRFPPPQMDSL